MPSAPRSGHWISCSRWQRTEAGASAQAALPERPAVREHAAGFIFLNRIGGSIDLDNLADRVIKPIFEANGMESKAWHAYRRGLATNLKELGVEDTTIPCILRHEDVSTTQRFYIKNCATSGAGGNAYFGGKSLVQDLYSSAVAGIG
jgi:integrase